MYLAFLRRIPEFINIFYFFQHVINTHITDKSTIWSTRWSIAIPYERTPGQWTPKWTYGAILVVVIAKRNQRIKRPLFTQAL